MFKLAVYGAGGFGKEVQGMIEMNQSKNSFAGYIDDFQSGIPILQKNDFDDVLIAIADPIIRKRIVENWNRKKVDFTNLICADISLHPSVKVDRGAIICAGVKMTVDIHVGSFTIINLNSTIGHDVQIGDYCSIMPSVNISGNVKIGEGTFIGAGATILQNLSIGAGAIIGAGAVVTHSVLSGESVKGVPARSYT
ncbi:MAG: NeuD/PglB/VioB family sugar acetyltransferase [Cyclobacteriaceae bacterium]|nr:NeuD/PglB/VioB family sugar acetyltransferase [Cyclobacteriaceae bacterium]